MWFTLIMRALCSTGYCQINGVPGKNNCSFTGLYKIFLRGYLLFTEAFVRSCGSNFEPVRDAHVANGLNANFLSVIYNPSNSFISVQKLRSSKPHDERCTPYFGTIGNFKGPSRLIDLADYLKANKFSHSINVFGNAPRRSSMTKDVNSELLKIQDRQNLSEELYEFKYRGFVESPELEMKLADFLVRPSMSNDPWGRDVIEGMSMEELLSQLGILMALLKTVNGFLIGDWDTQTVGSLIVDTWNDKEKYKNLQNNAALFAQKAFSPKQSASKFLGLIIG